MQTLLNTLIITAGEQQTMNFYMNIGPTYPKELGRQLYQEIAMVEEQHVTQYGALLDTGRTWLENLVLRDYMESYLYYSFSTDEPDRHIRKIWEIFFEQEVAHLHKAVEALKKYEKKEWQQVISGTGEYPELLHFKTQKEYVREVLASQIELTADRETFVDIHDLPAGHEFFDWQKKVNGKTRNIPSHEVVEEYIGKNGRDYRSEEAENPGSGPSGPESRQYRNRPHQITIGRGGNKHVCRRKETFRTQEKIHRSGRSRQRGLSCRLLHRLAGKGNSAEG